MNGCQTCGGFGMHHDPVAHDQVIENDDDAAALDCAETLDVIRSWLTEFSPYMPEPIRDAWARDLADRITATPNTDRKAAESA